MFLDANRNVPSRAAKSRTFRKYWPEVGAFLKDRRLDVAQEAHEHEILAVSADARLRSKQLLHLAQLLLRRQS